MKNKIRYFYNMIIDKIVEYDDYSVIQSENNIFILKKIYDKNTELIKSNEYFKIITNNFGDIVTNIENEDFILMLLMRKYENLYDNFNIDVYPTESNVLTSELWTKKVEYLKQQIINFGNDKYELVQSFNYFCGLAENAISIMKKCERKGYVKKNFICHKRIYYPNNTINYYDPTCYIIDYKARDVAEYIKSYFFKSKESKYDDIKRIIEKFALNSDDFEIMYARLTFPTAYFDYFEKNIFSNKLEYSESKNNVDDIYRYKNLLKELYNYFENYYKKNPSIYIEWINK